MRIEKDRMLKRVRRLRGQCGLSQAEAARRLECSRGHLNHIETGDTLPGFSLLLRMAKLYSTTSASIVGVRFSEGDGFDKYARRVLAKLELLREEY